MLLKQKTLRLLASVAIIFTAGIFTCQKNVNAQTVTGVDFGKPDFNLSLGGNMHANLDDTFMGGDIGVFDNHNLWGLSLGFDARPSPKKVLVKDQPGLFYQYHENLMMFELEVDKYFFPFAGEEKAKGLYIELGGAHLFGSYRGTNKNPGGQWILTPGSGFSYNVQNIFFIKIGYKRVPTLSFNIPDHRINLEAKLVLDFNND